MDHTMMRDKIFALYDGELSAAEQQAAQKHLAACGECRRRAAQWKRVAGVLFRPDPAPSSEALIAGIMSQLPTLAQPNRWAWVFEAGWLAPAVGVAAWLLLALNPLQKPVSLEAVLLSDDGEPAALTQLASASPDEMVDLFMEEGR